MYLFTSLFDNYDTIRNFVLIITYELLVLTQNISILLLAKLFHFFLITMIFNDFFIS